MVEPQYQPQNKDNSGMGVVLGILIAVMLVVGGYFFMQAQGVAPNADTTTVNVETPAPTNAEPAAGAPVSDNPAPVAP